MNLEIDDIVHSLNFIRPNAEWLMRGLEIEWLDTKQTEPTTSEIEAGWVAYLAKTEADKVAAQAQKQAILNRLGLTEDELRIVLG